MQQPIIIFLPYIQTNTERCYRVPSCLKKQKFINCNEKQNLKVVKDEKSMERDMTSAYKLF